MLLLSAWGLFDFREWLHNDAGQKTVDVLIRIALILFFSAIGWTVLASLIENRLASDIHGRPLPSARARTLLTLFRNALAVVISTITVMILLSEIGGKHCAAAGGRRGVRAGHFVWCANPGQRHYHWHIYPV
ncbi:Potassium efflux system KefA protein / Small-conductance mechanosensitive channel [Klebsiella pneumoniae]|uniref:Potassium efflux system KefA protein / Small-conductance mechanosensitive channel n=1 Tax=Klebsiella pneumoniae TaxID=573 RepID=A0A377W6W8_KLEPN|nr:Potassium efflux system KefA protein / Small-conductance mechanosensitive channel [Klebsiella pneumoniae]